MEFHWNQKLKFLIVSNFELWIMLLGPVVPFYVVEYLYRNYSFLLQYRE